MCGYHFTNVADKYIAESVRKVFEKKFGQIKWIEYDIRKMCDKADIDGFNKYDAIVIGGGGFILPSSFYVKKETGWVIGIPTNLVEKIEIPIIGFGIGYNLFRGEEFNSPAFVDNFNTILDHSPFFSLRHKGDIRKVEEIIGRKSDIRLEFCSSLFGREYKESHGNIISFQLAWDRIKSRFGSANNKDRFTKDIIEVIKYFSNTNSKLSIVSHTNSDKTGNEDLVKKLIGNGISCELVNLIGADVDTLTDFYYGVKTTFTMRGHGQMIPMGLGCDVVSLISHDKVKYLLEDLDIVKTGVEVTNDNLVDNCLEAYKESCRVNFKSKLEKARRNINGNMEIIRGLITK